MRDALMAVVDDRAKKIVRGSHLYVYGYDDEDLIQEVRFVLWSALQAKGLGPQDIGRVYNAWGKRRILKLFRESFAQKRCNEIPCVGFVRDELCDPVTIGSFAVDISPNDDDTPHVPPCHVRGEDPEGYDGGDPLCHNCADKFSCLVETEEIGLTKYTTQDDAEVALIASLRENPTGLAIAYEVVTLRMEARVRLRVLGQKPPHDLDVKHPPVIPAKSPRETRPIGASKAVNIPERRYPKELPGAPRPRKAANMYHALANVRIGQPFELLPGRHVLVRAKHGQDTVCVEIMEDGFRLNLNGETYASLSSAATAAEILQGASPTSKRPGNPYFHLVRNRTTEIRCAMSGATLACSKGTL